MKEQQLIALLVATAFVSGLIGLLFKIAFDWMKGKKNGNPGMGLRQIQADVTWLKEAHDQKDGSGMPLWYVPREWKKTLDMVGERTIETNVILKQILGELQDQRHLLQEKS